MKDQERLTLWSDHGRAVEVTRLYVQVSYGGVGIAFTHQEWGAIVQATKEQWGVQDYDALEDLQAAAKGAVDAEEDAAVTPKGRRVQA